MKKSVLSLMAALAFSSSSYAESEFDTFAVPTPSAQERANTNWLRQVNAEKTHLRNITGKGVRVGVLDTGLDMSNVTVNRELFGRIITPYDATTKKAGVTDTWITKHGTMVSNIIGAKADGIGMYGIAPEVNITPIRVFDNAGRGAESYFNNGITYATKNKIKILNASLGSTGQFGASGLAQAVKSGALVVVAAGNSAGANPLWPARYAKETWANGQVIAVGAVDSNNVIASFSNRAGDTAKYFLVAPGVNIVSSCGSASSSGYCIGSGTSYAAPIVTGAAALLQQNWPKLSAGQTADILLRTAKDLGAPGTDSIYGRGLLDIEKAYLPIGTVNTVSRAGTAVAVKTVSGTAAKPMGDAFKSVKMNMEGYDEYNRNYSYKLSAMLQSAPVTSLAELTTESSALQVAEKRLGKNTYKEASLVSNGQFSANFNAGSYSYNVGSGNMARYAFGLGASDNQVFALASDFTKNPYLGLLPNHNHAFIGQNLDNGVGLKAGLISNYDLTALTLNPVSATNMSMIEVSKKGEGYLLSASVGTLDEQTGVLGSAFSSGFNNSGSSTMNYNFSAAYSFSDRLSMAANFSQGITKAGSSSGLMALSDSVSQSWSLGLVGSEIFQKSDKFAVSLSSPLSIVKGSATLNAATGTNEAGDAIFSSESVSLAPSERELRSEVRYSHALSEDSRISYGLISRLNPNNDGSKPREDSLVLNFVKKF